LPVDAERFAALREGFVTALVTGTNGKTTTTAMLAAIVSAAGERSARATTLGAWIDDDQVAEGTALAAFEAMLEGAHAAGVRTLAIETTSKALAAGFSHRWPGRVAVFTNLTHDHLDEHGDPARYLAAKAQAFVTLPAGGSAVLNLGDPASALIAQLVPERARVLGFARAQACGDCAALPATLIASRVETSLRGTRLELVDGALARAIGGEITLRVIGEVHAENALAAAVAAHALGYAPEAIARGLARFPGVPGRFELVFTPAAPATPATPSACAATGAPVVVIDYAHTPDALARVLATARVVAAPGHGRVLCVFGCGGDRDPSKRAEMGRVAAMNADLVVLTTDNPRSEDPVAIAAAVRAGVPNDAALREEPDRAQAIEWAIRAARTGDIVLVAGKGHERTQTIGASVFPFSDADIARGVLAALHI
jgi:UDP-N-acetylmuramoyl-L-alanyl-D-glutamate--2,6-diaminopimelate ligase